MLAGSLCAGAEVASTLYLIGEPAGGWDTSKGIEMTKTSDGVFEIDVELQGTNSFGFVKTLGGDWTAFNSCRYTPAERGQVPVIGENEMLYTGDDSNDYSWDLGAGSYHFTVDTNTMKFILAESSGGGDTPVPPAVTDLFFTGEVNSWSFLDDYKLENDGKLYYYRAGVIRGGLPFKISANNWNPAYTSQNENMVKGQNYSLTFGDGLTNMALAEDIEDAVLIVNTESLTLTVTDAAAIGAIEADSDHPAEYYTLQGVRVANPTEGFYIVRRGAEVSKTYIHGTGHR